MNYQDLAAELIAGHPVSGAYNANDELAAVQINALDISRVRANMTGAEIVEAIDVGEYTALTDEQKNRFLTFTSGNNTINPRNGGLAVEVMTDIFGGGSATITTLNALRQETVSRATELNFGRVSAGDILYARSI